MKQGILYIIKLEKSNLYKIGITSTSIEIRNSRIKEPYTIVYSKTYDSIVEAYKEEQLLLSQNKKYKYIGEKVLVSGNTELFTKSPIIK